MKQIITFLNRKEGCGKTTLGLNLAAVMASEMGLKAAFLDYAENNHDTELILDTGGQYGFEPLKGIYGNFFKEANFYLFWSGAADLRQLVERIYDEVDIMIIDTKGLPPAHLLEISDKLLVPSALNAVDIKFANFTVQWLLS
jgi:cellulose biosynthesis protein BcsQ